VTSGWIAGATSITGALLREFGIMERRPRPDLMYQTAPTMIAIAANPPITPPTIPPTGTGLGVSLAVAVGGLAVELLELVADTEGEMPVIIAVLVVGIGDVVT
jgi:hypothetical protein